MNIKDLVTKEQYKELKKDYKRFVKDKSISFFDFCTKEYKLTNYETPITKPFKLT